MLIICGVLVNGPYALITTAVSADLVSGPLWAPGWSEGAGGALCASPFPLSLAPSLVLQNLHGFFPFNLRAPSPPTSASFVSALLFPSGFA